MSNLDMMEAVRLLAAEKGISVETLLQVLADALVSAYKRRARRRRRGRGRDRPRHVEIRIIAYDIDEDGELVNPELTTRPTTSAASPPRPFRQVMNQRIREAERERKFEEYADREGDIVTGIIQQSDSRYTLLDLGRGRGAAAPGRAGALRAARARAPG